tara:strand:- start:124 stop:1059 length:936 start_codon:yes stop_codon:yes gene_type:complete
MIDISPIKQKKLYGLDRYIDELVNLDKSNKLPNKILLTGQKGVGKSTLAYHFINYSLSKNEKFNYSINNYEINPENSSFKTIQNKSNPNFILLDLNDDKKFIDIKQVRDLISTLTKSSFNEKPRYILIDNVESLNKNSINALLKIIEEPSFNTHFFLINDNSKKILPTLSSRCINFKISLSNQETLEIADRLLDKKLYEIINQDLINYYFTPGKIYRLVQFGKILDYDLSDLDLKSFLKIFIKNKHYKKIDIIKYLVFDLVESYLRKITYDFKSNIFNQSEYFLKRISDTKRFNLDEESLFIEFDKKILNG